MTFLARWFGEEPAPTDLGTGKAALASREDAAEAGADRRNREIAPAALQLRDVIAQKVLHGWLQNRHQTLMPLSVNLSRLSEPDRTLVARFAALAALAGGEESSPDRVRAWLASVGGGEPTLASFSVALEEPPSLPACLAELARPEMAPLAFVAALIAARDGGPAARLFADFVAARLSLSSAAIRSAERRYRA